MQSYFIYNVHRKSTCGMSWVSWTQSTSLRSSRWVKLGYCIHNHSWAATSTSSLWNQWSPKCCFSDHHKLCVMKCDPSAQCSIPTQRMSDTRVELVSLKTPGPVILETPGTTHPKTGCYIPEDFNSHPFTKLNSYSCQYVLRALTELCKYCSIILCAVWISVTISAFNYKENFQVLISLLFLV